MSCRVRRIDEEGVSSSEDDDEEDAFAVLSKNKTQRPKLVHAKNEHGSDNTEPITGSNAEAPIVAPINKRHHASTGSDARKQKLDALVEELSSQTPATLTRHQTGAKISHSRGSFVQPGEEHLTTNVFVGNLPPSVTEEEVGYLFGQFGELYSVKIMYPRTAEERSRNRHSGFVCFCNRQDAQDAIAACNDRDVFGKGHRLQLNWGRRVELHGRNQAVAKISDAVCTLHDTAWSGASGKYDPMIHGATAIHVRAPSNPQRLQLISSVATFVAKDGSQMELNLLQQYHSNIAPDFDFLVSATTSQLPSCREDHIYYKWRVYSFAQGDSWHVWKTTPFQLVHGGCYWIPPSVDLAAARREQEAQRVQQEEMERQKRERRMQGHQQKVLIGCHTGNYYLLNHLNREDLQDFHRLTRVELCGSRESVAQAMSFCFEKSGAADQISTLLKVLLTETTEGDENMDAVIARLYLLSDILYNSQQPGVKNAFRYRDAIERLAPDVFDSLHRFGQDLGRMKLNKLARVVRNLLLAWQGWDVFHTSFIDELRARFDGGVILEGSRGLKDQERIDKPSALLEAEDKQGDGPVAPATLMAVEPPVVRMASHSDVFETVARTDENVDGEPFNTDVDEEEEVVKHCVSSFLPIPPTCVLLNQHDGLRSGEAGLQSVAVDRNSEEDLDDDDGESIDGESLNGDSLDGKPFD
ncbi:hypothetical protein MPSEU_000427000 [Mayamaea pseudoterrestris]|nr:hypothetical protein MPSEU_000427000 [Mayamaea pseudoterrestris]